jgi:hypothetical protein
LQIPSNLFADTFGPTYSTLPTLTGKIGQIVDAGSPQKTLQYNVAVEIRNLTIPYTGVWLINLSMYIGGYTGGLVGVDIRYGTILLINSNFAYQYNGTNLTGIEGSKTINLSQNDVVSFTVYLAGADASSLTSSQRSVYGPKYTWLTATRIA